MDKGVRPVSVDAPNTREERGIQFILNECLCCHLVITVLGSSQPLLQCALEKLCEDPVIEQR